MDLVQIASRLAARFSGPGNVSVVEQSTNYPDYPGSIYLYSVLMDGEEYEVEVGLYGKQQKETEALGAWLLDPDTHERTEADANEELLSRAEDAVLKHYKSERASY